MRVTSPLVLVGFLIAGCGQGSKKHMDTRPWPDDPTRKERDPSYFDKPPGRRIEQDEFDVVKNGEAEAIAKLERSPCIELTPKEAEDFLGRTLGGRGGKLILIRALAINNDERERQSYLIYWRDGAVHTPHIGHVIGKREPTLRRAIVIRLPELPKEVHLETAIAE